MHHTTYDRVAITLHWVMALCIISMLFLGFFMEDIRPASLRFQGVNFHKSLGITLLFLSFGRLAWRLTHTAPALPAHMGSFEKFAAHTAHWGLYFFMVTIPLSGWLFVSAFAKYPISFFGLFHVPYLLIHGKAAGSFFNEVHELLAYGLIALLAAHVLAALKHHFYDRDDVLAHMIPILKRS